MFGLYFIFSSDHHSVLFPILPTELLFSLQQYKQESSKQYSRPEPTCSHGGRHILEVEWVLFLFFLGIAVHGVFHGHHINHFSTLLAVEKSLASRLHRE